jgi:hypothetical protein
MECLALGVEAGQVPDLEEAVVLQRARDCQRMAEVHQIWSLPVSRRRLRVSLVAVVEVEVLDSRHSTKLLLCLVELEEGLQTSLLLRLAAAP